MTVPLIVILAASLILAYTWAGYPALLWMAALVKKKQPAPPGEQGWPGVSVIVACHNEEARIAAKLEDCLAWQYPHDRLEIIVASDGSTDATERIVEEFAARDSRIQLLRSAGRAGKSGAQNLAAAHAGGDILLFTDAETQTRPNLLQQIAEDFADHQIGLVAPIVQLGRLDDAVSKGQGFYWRFELFLRERESELGMLATASGSAMAVRRSLYRPIPLHYGDDCIIPLDVRLQGFGVLQDSRCVVSDEMPHSIKGELRARIRMTARNWTGILSRPALLNPFRFPGIAFGLISHKLLRWLTPFLMAMAFLASTLLLVKHQAVWLWSLQAAFYLCALLGWLRTRKQRPAWIFSYPFSFCLANIGFALGMVKVLRGQKITSYQSAQ
jgi:cellulose synthase/poly-beta-1,6-N-acetylglucosamine synthase-like glycosyltransferase